MRPDAEEGTNSSLVVFGPGDIRLVQRAPLTQADGEVVVEPDLVGLCGTDLEIIDGLIDPAYISYPVVLGHEWTGIAAGDTPLAGRRVVVEGMIGCGRCDRCAAGQVNLCHNFDEIGFTRDGAAAGQITVPAALVHPLGPQVAAQDAVLTEPAAVVYRGLVKAGVTPGCRALVIGDGTIALLTVLLLSLWSPAEIAVLGQRPEQAGLAEAAGATSFDVTGVTSTMIAKEKRRRRRQILRDHGIGGTVSARGGFDLVVEAAGATEAVTAALGAARRGGTVLLLGLPPHGQTVPLAADDVVNNDLTIHGSFSYTPAAWRAAVALLDAGRLRPGLLVTHRYPLPDWEQAIATLRGASGPRGKVLLQVRPSPAAPT